MKIAVIPARGGSKRIPRKNIRPFHGKPIIAWSISAAKACECFDTVIVSTDDPEIAEIGLKYGAEVPFMRPPELSDDHTPTVPVIAHAIRYFSMRGDSPSAVCCIYPTAPMVRPEYIQAGLGILEQSDCEYVVAVAKFEYPIQRALRMSEDGVLEMLDRGSYLARSQDLDPAWHDAGQFYWGRASAWTEERGLFSGNSIGVRVPGHLVQDIDTEEDWVRAEQLFPLAMIGNRS